MPDTRTPRYPKPDSGGADAIDPRALVVPSRRTAMAQIDLANGGYSEQVRQIQTLEMDFAVELTACETSTQAMAVVARWMAKRVDALIGVQREILDAWLAYSTTQANGYNLRGQALSIDAFLKRTRRE